MSVSEHANYLLNEYGRLQFDYAAYCKPYGESLRNEARNNLEEYITELEEENDRLQGAWFEEDEMRIGEPTNSLLVRLEGLTHKFEQGLERIQEYEKEVDAKKEILIEAIKIRDARIAELESVIDQLIEVSEKMFTAVIAAADSYDEGMRVWDKIVNDWKEG